MKILKLKLTNFIPYFGESSEIVLFEGGRKNRNVTLNIGPTGHGKTSISRAVMWCFFGEQYDSKWESLINDLALELAKQTRQKSVKMAVEMEVEIEGDTFVILRVGTYDTETGKRESDTKLFVRLNGETIKGDPENFINEKFLPVGLMEYFIFDADDMLGLFEKNQEKTVRDHINKIVGVETLDIMSETLSGAVLLYEGEVGKIQHISPGVSKQSLEQEVHKKTGKLEAIHSLNTQIENYEKSKRKLFPKGRLSAEELRLKEIMDSQHSAEDKIKELNKRLEENQSLIANMHLLFLKEIIEQSIDSLNNTNTTKIEFDSAMNILKSTLEGKYAGVVLDDEQPLLIRRGAKVKEGELDKVEKLKLVEGSGIKVVALQQLNGFNEWSQRTEKEFFELKKEFAEAQNKLTSARNQLKQIGKTEKNQELRKKIDDFLGYDKKIQEYRHVLEETQLELAKIEATINNLTKEHQTTEENKKKMEKIRKKIEKILFMKNVIDKTKQLFLKNLLEEVNQNASEFFRGVVKAEDSRLHSIVVDSDYKLNVRTQNGVTLEPKQISKGNTQIALMAFFFGLSKFLKNRLPYIIDDPIIRLDPGHDKRLIQHLCKSEQQIIMHMIPGKEYTQDSFDWLKPFVNTQNWINRRRDKGESSGSLKSYSEQKDPNKFVEYDIDKL